MSAAERDVERVEDVKPPKPFSSFLLEIRKGKSEAELSQAVQDVVTAVRETGKKGTITYTMVVSPSGKTLNGHVVEDKITVKLPEGEREGSIFFSDEEGNLHRNDPSQMTLGDL